MSRDSNFAYAIGRIRAIEKKLLDKNKFERMIDSKSPEEALKVIAEAGYSEASSFSDNTAGYENMLKEEERKLYALLKEISSESEVFDIFLLKNDYHNIKVIIKSEFLGIEADDSLLNSGTIPISQIKMFINDRNFSKLPVYMKESIEESIDTFSRTKDPRHIDLILDRVYYKHILKLSEESGYDYVNNLVKVMIDMTNIKTYLRIRNLNMPIDLLNRSIIPGGTIDNSIFIKNFNESLNELLDKTKSMNYHNILIEGITTYTTKGSFSKLEKLLDNYIVNSVKKTKYSTFGIEPLIGYLIAKENEIRNLRIVMVGKINNISADIIRERLRETYV